MIYTYVYTCLGEIAVERPNFYPNLISVEFDAPKGAQVDAAAIEVAVKQVNDVDSVYCEKLTHWRISVQHSAADSWVLAYPHLMDVICRAIGEYVKCDPLAAAIAKAVNPSQKLILHL